MPLCKHLLLAMSTNLAPNDLKDTDCKKGSLLSGLLLPTYKPTIAEPNKIKLKLPGGNQITCALLQDMSNADTYVKHLQLFYRVMEEKKLDVKLNQTTDAVAAALAKVK